MKLRKLVPFLAALLLFAAIPAKPPDRYASSGAELDCCIGCRR